MAVPRLSRFHLLVWTACAALAMVVAVNACLRYNEVAGTDMTPGEIAAVALGVNLGSFVGPIHNNSQDRWAFAYRLGLPALGLLTASMLPFLLIRKPVGWVTRSLFNVSYVAACMAWFAGGMLSLAFSLS